MNCKLISLLTTGYISQHTRKACTLIQQFPTFTTNPEELWRGVNQRWLLVSSLSSHNSCPTGAPLPLMQHCPPSSLSRTAALLKSVNVLHLEHQSIQTKNENIIQFKCLQFKLCMIFYRLPNLSLNRTLNPMKLSW